jgi:hypothetical protein
MDDITVEITGLSDLQDRLEELAKVDALAIVRDGLDEGGEALRSGMMIEGSTNKGEIGRALRQKSNWSKRITMGDELSGTARISPKGSLPALHVARGGGMQSKGHIYRRSLKYIVKMLEFGGRNPAENLGHSAPMTRGFEVYKNAALERVIDVIKQQLQLSDDDPSDDDLD